MSKKKLLSLALVVIMIAILSLSTLAWFNDSESVTNKFLVASSDGTNTPDSIFSVDLWEKTPGGDKDQDGHSYEAILPGSNLKKEVNVENTGAYDQYIRVVVTLSDGKAWLKVLGAGYDLDSIFFGHDESKWTRSVGTIVDDEIIIEDDLFLEEEDFSLAVEIREYVETFEDEIEEEPIPFALVEEKPKFNGKDANEFSRWVNQRLVYPEIAKENGVQGRITMMFTVKADGTVADVKVVRGVDPALDREAVRVISSSPKWSPGKQRDRTVPVTYTFPVIFRLR